jgi:SM-20-related protein
MDRRGGVLQARQHGPSAVPPRAAGRPVRFRGLAARRGAREVVAPAPAIRPHPAFHEMFDLLEIEGFLDEATRAELVAELDAAHAAPSTVLSGQAGGRVDTAARRSKRIAASPETVARVREALMARKEEIEAHFGIPVTECEEPQFLRYETGDYFVPHQDGNTPMVWDDSRFRRISVVIFLSQRADAPAPDTYGGGMLVFHVSHEGRQVRAAADATPGSLAAFRSETTHEVTPVTHGVRYTIATWFR